MHSKEQQALNKLKRINRIREKLYDMEDAILRGTNLSWQLVVECNKIRAIKMYRTEVGCSLKTAKEAVESYLEEVEKESAHLTGKW